MDKYLTAAEVAAVLRVSLTEAMNMCEDGTLHATNPAGVWLVAERDFQTFMDSGYTDEGAA